MLWHGRPPVGLLRIFGVQFGGVLLFVFFFVYLLFFCFGINPTGEIGIQLDVSLWSQER